MRISREVGEDGQRNGSARVLAAQPPHRARQARDVEQLHAELERLLAFSG